MALASFAYLNATYCCVVLLLLSATNAETKNHKDLTTFQSTNKSLASTTSHRKGKFFFDELFGLNAGVGLSADEDDDDEDEAPNNVKTCNCGE